MSSPRRSLPQPAFMTHLGQFLATLIREEKIDAKKLSKRIGIHESVLSRLMHGRRTSCSERTRQKIIFGCTKRPIKQAHCLAALLQDQLPAPLQRLVTISLQGEAKPRRVRAKHAA